MMLLEECCGTCSHWIPPMNWKYTKLGECPLVNKEKYPDEKCISWGWAQASKEQIESRVKVGLIKLEEVGA